MKAGESAFNGVYRIIDGKEYRYIYDKDGILSVVYDCSKFSKRPDGF